MRGHRYQWVALACVLALAPVLPAAAECGAATLKAFAPPGGQIPMRKALGRFATVERTTELRTAQESCLAEESDDDCRARIAAAWAAEAGDGQRVDVTLEGALDGVHAVLTDGDGQPEERHFDSHEQLEAYLETEEARARGLSLVSAGDVLDRAQRTVVVRIVEASVEERSLGPGQRVWFVPEGSALEAYGPFADAAAAAGIEIVQWSPRPEGGGVVVDLRCAGAE